MTGRRRKPDIFLLSLAERKRIVTLHMDGFFPGHLTRLQRSISKLVTEFGQQNVLSGPDKFQMQPGPHRSADKL